MKIKKKFIFEVTILSTILAIASFIAISNTLYVEKNFSQLNNELIPRLSLLKDMRLIASNVQTSTLEFALIGEDAVTTNQNPSMTDPALSEIVSEAQRGKMQFNELLTLYVQKSSNPDNDTYLDRIKKQWQKFEILSDKFVEYRTGGISGAEFVKMTNEFKGSKDDLFKEIDLAILANEKEVAQKGKLVSDLVHNTIIIVSLVVLIFVIVFIVMRYYILKSILIPILKIRNTTKKIAGGNLDVRIEDISKDEIGELSQDINQMAGKLESSQQQLLKSEKLSVVGTLAARMAHDLRNPLTIILIGIENLKRKYKTSDDANFDTINRATERISHQIQDVLDFVKTTPLKIEKVSLSSLLNHVVENQRLPGGVELVLPQNDVTIECDYRKIEVLFINLLRNAIDAVKTSGKIQVRFIDLGSTVRIEVEDSGSGIPAEDKEKIFEPLFTTKQKGTGLGLSSVKNIVEEHGGTITFSNNPTVFAVELSKKAKNLPTSHATE